MNSTPSEGYKSNFGMQLVTRWPEHQKSSNRVYSHHATSCRAIWVCPRVSKLAITRPVHCSVYGWKQISPEVPWPTRSSLGTTRRTTFDCNIVETDRYGEKGVRDGMGWNFSWRPSGFVWDNWGRVTALRYRDETQDLIVRTFAGEIGDNCILM